MSSITDNKIAPGEVTQVFVQRQDDRLHGTPTQNKKVFDEYPDLIRYKHNAALDAIEAKFALNDADIEALKQVDAGAASESARASAESASESAQTTSELLGRVISISNKRYVKDWDITDEQDEFEFTATDYTYNDSDTYEVFVNGLKLENSEFTQDENVVTLNDAISGTGNTVEIIVTTNLKGKGIADTELNDDYTLTITYDDGTSTTTESIRGEKGEKGDKGDEYDDTEVKTDIAVLESRVDSFTHLTEGSTTGDAELIDARIGADGTTYANAGDAVRGQVNDVNKTLDWFGHALGNTNFERGSYNFSTGTKAGDAKRLRTKKPVRVKEKTIVKVDNLNGLYYTVYVFQGYDSGNDVLSSLLFSSVGAFSNDSNTKWNTNDYIYIPVSGYMVILIANGKNYASSTDIQLSDNNGEWFISNEPIENPISSEIFTTENCTTGVYVKESDGTTGGNSSTGATDYIDLDDYYDVIVLNNPNGQVHQGAFYDENKAFVAGYYRSAAGDFYVTVPRGAKYIRVSYVLSLASSYKIGVVFKEGIATRFYNLKMNCLGDSITYGYIPDSGAQMANPYPSILKDLLGLAECRNYGISGSTLAVNSGNYQPMCIRYASMRDDADIVLVFGGTNDYGRAVYTPTLGTINDSVNTTVYGALNILCDGLITKYPKAFIFLCTPLKRADKTGANGGGYTLEDVANAIREVGLKFGIPVLDLDAKGGFYISNSTFRAQYGGNDKLHPNQAFDTDHLAPMIAKFIESNM